MNLEYLIEILKVWNIAVGNTQMVEMLEGEKSVDEYVDGVLSNSSEHLKESNEDLEKENAKENPSELMIAHYNNWIKRVETMQKRFSLYRDKA